MTNSSDEEKYEDPAENGGKTGKGKQTPGLPIKSSDQQTRDGGGENPRVEDLLERTGYLSADQLRKIFGIIGDLHRKYQVTFKDESLSVDVKDKRLTNFHEKIDMWETRVTSSYGELLPDEELPEFTTSKRSRKPDVKFAGISALQLSGFWSLLQPQPQVSNARARRGQNRPGGSGNVSAAAGTVTDPLVLDEERIEILRSQLGLCPLELKFNEFSIEEACKAEARAGSIFQRVSFRGGGGCTSQLCLAFA